MPWRGVAVCTLLATLVWARVDASDEGPASKPRRFSVTFAAGAHLNDGGDAQELSFGYMLGYTPLRAWSLLVNVERNHLPTRVRAYPDGYSATRGGTLTSISGEFRYAGWHRKRVSPFGLAGTGFGVWRPNVHELFPPRDAELAQLLYYGGGALFTLHPALAVSVEAKLAVVVAGRQDFMTAMLPIRAGVTWRF